MGPRNKSVFLINEISNIKRSRIIIIFVAVYFAGMLCFTFYKKRFLNIQINRSTLYKKNTI